MTNRELGLVRFSNPQKTPTAMQSRSGWKETHMQSTVIQQKEQGTLTQLANQINDEHRQAEQAINAGLEHALRAGQLLLEAKGLCAHGEWTPWLEDNFAGSARTARAYMLVAERWPQIEAKRQRVANLSFRDALRLAAPPKPEPLDAADATQGPFGSLPVDAVLFAAIPELSSDTMLFAFDPDDDSYAVEVHPSIAHPGYYHVLVSVDLDTDNAEVIYDRRPGKYDRRLLAYVLQRVHGVKPTIFRSEPAARKEPWCVEADKTSIPGRFHGAKKTV